MKFTTPQITSATIQSGIDLGANCSGWKLCVWGNCQGGSWGGGSHRTVLHNDPCFALKRSRRRTFLCWIDGFWKTAAVVDYIAFTQWKIQKVSASRWPHLFIFFMHIENTVKFLYNLRRIQRNKCPNFPQEINRCSWTVFTTLSC